MSLSVGLTFNFFGFNWVYFKDKFGIFCRTNNEAIIKQKYTEFVFCARLTPN